MVASVVAVMRYRLGNSLAHARCKFVDFQGVFTDQVRQVLVYLKEIEPIIWPGGSTCRPLAHGNSPATQRAGPRPASPMAAGPIGRADAVPARARRDPLGRIAVERALKAANCYRKHSLFCKTLRGSAVGDMYMSLIHTCFQAKADPLDYLTPVRGRGRLPISANVCGGANLSANPNFFCGQVPAQETSFREPCCRVALAIQPSARVFF